MNNYWLSYIVLVIFFYLHWKKPPMIILRKITTSTQGSGASVAIAQGLSGTVNGINKIFTTPHDYRSNRISLLFNGQSLHSPNDFLETNNNEITLINIAPIGRDVLRVMYEYDTVASGGVSDHGDLDGLLDDDHPQYLSESRGDARYYTHSEVDSMVGISRTGQFSLASGTSSASISFNSSFTTIDYSLSVSLINTVDSDSASYTNSITSKSISGFDVAFSGDIDSDNYILDWIATTSGINPNNCIADVVNDVTPQLGGNLDLRDYSIVMDALPDSNYGASGMIYNMQVDWNDTGVGCPLHMDTDGHLIQCTAVSGSTSMPCSMLALETGTGMKRVLWTGSLRSDAWSWTQGDRIYVSTVDGALTNVKPNNGHWKQEIGVASHSNVIMFRPKDAFET